MRAKLTYLSSHSSRFVGIVFFLLFVFPVESQSQTYPFKHYSTADGLVQATVKKVFQDSRGFLWFGTSGGASKYDGVEFRDYLFQGAEKSAVTDIWEDDKGTLWFATYGNGIAKLPSADTAFSWLKAAAGILPTDFTAVLFRDHRKSVWIGTDKGLVVLKPDGSSKQYNDTSGLPDNFVRTIAEEVDGTMWIGTDGGLVRARIDSDGQLHTNRIVDLPTYSLIVLRNGDILAGTSGGGDNKRGAIFRYHSGELDTIISYAKTKSLVKGVSLYESSQGDVWAGTSYGLYFLERDRITRIRTEHGLHNEYINDILEDREGTMWFATNNGVTKLPARRFLTYGMTQGLSSYIVISMLEDHRKNFWFGTYNGLTRLEPNGRVTTFGKADGLSHEVINCLAEDANGTIWVGTPRGLNLISQGKIQKKNVEGLTPGSYVVSILRADNGDMWLGGEGRIIKIVNGSSALVLDKTVGVPTDPIRSLCLDSSGTLWFGTDRYGVGYFRDGKVRMLTREHGLPDNEVKCIYQDDRGRLWLTTQRGVAIWQGGTMTRMAVSDPALVSGIINFVLQDSVNHLWFGTEYGVYEYADSIIQHLDSHDGLAADVVERGIVDRDGNLWFGTHGGVSRLDRSSRVHAIPIPKIYLDKITAGDHDRVLLNDARVGYKDRSLVFRFNALSFVDEATIEFQWRMEGLDHDWQPPHKQRQVRYTNLEPGKYVFAVRAANRNGNWSTPTSFTFTVRPPFWKTWWFISFAIVSIGSILALFYRYRVNQLLRVERMRTRIAADLHDDIASSLASVALYSEVIQRQMQNASDEVRALLGRIRDLSREVMENIGIIVWTVDPRRDELAEVLAYFQRQSGQLCAAAGITLLTRLPEKTKSYVLTPEQRRTIYLILKEGLNNIIRHAECSQVEFTCTLHGGTLDLALRDNGRGFNVNLASGSNGGHGLSNMRMRATAIGAELEIASPPGLGTTLRLRVRMT